MPLTLNGTTGIAGVDGSAGTPAIRGSDTNTGFVFGTDIIQVIEGGAESARFDASGNLLVGVTSANANGGVLQLKSGITFPATQVSASDVNTLDDYEEGTWTPTISSSGTAPTVSSYLTRQGTYTKIGNFLIVYGSLRATISSIGTGYPRITGLPFSALSASYAPAITSLATLFTVNPYTVSLQGYASNTNIEFESSTWSTSTNAYLTFTIMYPLA